MPRACWCQKLPVLSLFIGTCQGELEDSVKLLVRVIRKASVVNSSSNFEVFLHKIDGIVEYERVDLLDSVSKLQKESFLEAEMGDINLRCCWFTICWCQPTLNEVTERLKQSQPGSPPPGNCPFTLLSHYEHTGLLRELGLLFYTRCRLWSRSAVDDLAINHRLLC